MSHQVALVGDINVDVLLPVERYPRLGDDAPAREVFLRPGGTVANTGVVLAKLGVAVHMTSCVGQDPWAELALEALARVGMDLSGIRRTHQVGTGFVAIPVTPDGERTMFSYRGANACLQPEDIRPETLASACVLHMSGYNFMASTQREASFHALALARQRGLPLSLDVGLEPARAIPDTVQELLAQTRILSLGMEEAYRLWGVEDPEAALAAAAATGAELIGLKLGEAGCLVAQRDARIRLAGLPVEPVDTTGAGDAFTAGLIAGWVWGWPLDATALLANTLGGLATTVWGGGPALPGRAEVWRHLADRSDAPESRPLLDRLEPGR